MPIYEYLCEACNCQFETLVLKSDDPDPSCPTCCENRVKKLMSAGCVRAQGIPTGAGGFQAPKCAPSGG